MTAWSEVASTDVKQLCGYITDDQTIANYLGIHRDRVAKVRQSITRPRVKHSGAVRYSPGEGTKANAGHDQARIFAEECAASSKRLRIAIENLFERWEEDQGFAKGAGKVLLPAGFQS